MALWDSIKAVASGEFGKAADYAFLDSGEVTRGKDLDSKLMAEAQADYARGLVSDEQAAASFARLQESAFDNQVAKSSPAAGFVEGWKDGYNNVKGAIQKITSGALGGVWGLIPWQIKLAVVGIAAFYVYNWLKSAGILAKYLKLKG
jgi:hypothetical protein